MAVLQPHGILAAAELAFYVPAFLLSICICIKQGFSKNAGWFFMVLISVFRLIGASVVLYMVTQDDYSSGLEETAAITSAIGTAPLLLALLGFLKRINDSMEDNRGLPQMVFRPISLLLLAALILAIVGGTETAQSDPSSYNIGRILLKVTAIIFLLVWLLLAVIDGLAFSRRASAPASESKLLVASICVLPFLLVRVIYTVAVSFSTSDSIFAYPTPKVVVQATMMFAMEALALCFYIWAGLLTPRQVFREGDGRKEVEGQRAAVDSSGGLHAQESARHPRGQQERSIGDYRPSRLVRNAMRNH